LARALRQAQGTGRYGGDTAIAILTVTASRAAGARRSDAGIPYARIRVDGTLLWLVTKAAIRGARHVSTDCATAGALKQR